MNNQAQQDKATLDFLNEIKPNLTRVKVQEASGAVLDWMVATCLYTDRKVELTEGKAGVKVLRDPNYDGTEYSHWFIFFGSTCWAQGGPIIEREGIGFYRSNASKWWAHTYGGESPAEGPTALVAAMRCFVTSKLGNEVEVPDELM